MTINQRALIRKLNRIVFVDRRIRDDFRDAQTGKFDLYAGIELSWQDRMETWDLLTPAEALECIVRLHLESVEELLLLVKESIP